MYIKNLRVVFIFKNFAKLANNHKYVIGLGIACLNNTLTLEKNHIKTDMWGITECEEIENKINEDSKICDTPPTHIIISAFWIPTRKLAELCYKYKNIKFIVNSHSNVEFMHADRNAFALLKQGIELQRMVPNFNMSGNCYKFSEWASIIFDEKIAFLPNLYNLEGMKHSNYLDIFHTPEWRKRGIIKISNFGATRVLKGNLTACAAAMEVSKKLNVPVEFWLSSGRVDGGQSILYAIQQLTQNMPNFYVRHKEWAPWGNFREFIGTMDLNMQMSMSESFNMVLADSLYNGIPAVGSEVIEWLPNNCIAKLDDANNIADLGIKMLNSPHKYTRYGQGALEQYVNDGIKYWKKFLLK